MRDLQTIYVSWRETVKQWSPDGYLPQAWPCVFTHKRDGAEKYHHDDKFRALEAENKRLRDALSDCAQNPMMMADQAQAQFMIASDALAATPAPDNTEGEG